MISVKYQNLIKKSAFCSVFRHFSYPYELIKSLEDVFVECLNCLDLNDYLVDGNKYIHKTAKIDKTAVIIGPCIILENVEVGPYVYLRQNVIIESKAHIGHASEIKNSVILHDATIAHFNYVGDSIIGPHVHLGAGAKISNYRLDGKEIVIDKPTGVYKFGAMVDENTEIGCNAVINPGTIIGKNCTVYPLCSVKGIIDDKTIIKK